MERLDRDNMLRQDSHALAMLGVMFGPGGI